MVTCATIKELLEWRNSAELTGKSIGFIPTMGSLHTGHISLIKQAKKTCDKTIVSVFVNPLQFAPSEDLETYPRKLNDDSKLLQEADVDSLFTPDVTELYPPHYRTFVAVEELSDLLCGQHRQGHFRGVTTVVLKLFNLVRPNQAFFGEKDYQQLVIIKKMVTDLHIPVEIIGCPTIREIDGLAMSSRNIYLNTQERKSATLLYKALKGTKKIILDGERRPKKIRQHMVNLLDQDSIITIDYVAVCNPKTLQELETIENKILLAVACRIGKARLIDNIIVELPVG